MATYVPPKRATELIFYVGLVSQADTKLFQSNPTIAAGDFKVSIDGGALNNPTTLPSVLPASSKAVKITLSTSEMTGDNIQVICSDAAGAEWCDLIINIQTAAQQIDDLSTAASITALPAAIWDRLTSALTTVGSIGKLLVDRIDAAITSRMATFTLPTNFSALSIDANGRVKALVGLTKNTAFANFQFRMVDDAGNPVTGLTNASFTTKTFTIAGGAQGTITGTITEDPGLDGFYLVSLLAAELNGNSISFVFGTASTIQTALTVWPSQ